MYSSQLLYYMIDMQSNIVFLNLCRFEEEAKKERKSERKPKAESPIPPETDLLTPSDDGGSIADKLSNATGLGNPDELTPDPVVGESLLQDATKLEDQTAHMNGLAGFNQHASSMFTFPVETKHPPQPASMSQPLNGGQIFPHYPSHGMYQPVNRYQPYPSSSAWLQSPTIGIPSTCLPTQPAIIGQPLYSAPNLRPFQPESPTFSQFPPSSIIPQIVPPFHQTAGIY